MSAIWYVLKKTFQNNCVVFQFQRMFIVEGEKKAVGWINNIYCGLQALILE